jgi:replicative DNA helicase
MFGKQFISACVEQKATAEFIGYGNIEHLFKASEKDVYGFVKKFLANHGTLPTAETIEKHTGEALPKVAEPHSYYMDQMQARHTELVVKHALKTANNHLHPDHKDPDKALATLTDTVMRLQMLKHGKQVTDFRQAFDMIYADWKSKWDPKGKSGLMCGWPTLDEMSGGLVRGDLLSFIGRPAAGKTWQMLFAAHHGWDLAGKAELYAKANGTECLVPPQSRMFVSMEMSTLSIMQRLTAMQIAPGRLQG